MAHFVDKFNICTCWFTLGSCVQTLIEIATFIQQGLEILNNYICFVMNMYGIYEEVNAFSSSCIILSVRALIRD